MENLAIHQITFLQGGPEGLVRFASEAGLQRVCLFTETPFTERGEPMFPVVAPGQKQGFSRLLDDTGIAVINAEYFPVTENVDVASYEPAIALASELGAKRLVTHILDADANRSLDKLDALCVLAKMHNLLVGLEFTGFAGGCNSLEKAVTIQASLNTPNLQIAVDALHLFRTGGSLETLAQVDPSVIGYAQICDGPHFRKTSDYVDEAMNRMIPGEGFFPLREFVSLFGAHADFDIEVPHFASAKHFNAAQWASDAVAESQKLFI